MSPAAGKRKRIAANSGPKSKRGKKKPVKENGEDSDDKGESEWVVHEIVDKRIVRGKSEYLLRWKNWDPNDLTWEPVDNLNCPELLEKYEQKIRTPNGFSEGYTVRAVRGVVQLENGKGDQLCYLVEWEDHDRIEKIPAAVVREKVPQEVIKFLSSKIKWSGQKTPADEALAKTTVEQSKSSGSASASNRTKSDSVANNKLKNEQDRSSDITD